MPIAYILVDVASNYGILTLMGEYLCYNKNFLANQDTQKTTLQCPRALRIYEWIVMQFGLKNVSATYQKMMNVIFPELINKSMEVYIDDVVVKS